MRVERKAKHQQGSIRKVKRAQGFAWEYRYYDTVDGLRKPKSSYFSADVYPTEFDVRKAIEPQLKMMNTGTLAGKIQAVTLGTVIDRYLKDDTDACGCRMAALPESAFLRCSTPRAQPGKS